LDTGGGLKNALSFFDEQKPILVINSDIWWTSSSCWFLELYNHYTPGSILLGLILKEHALGYQGKGDYALEDGDRLRRRTEQEEVPYIFSGLRILDVSWIKKITQSVFSITLSFDKAEGEKALYGKVLKGLWSDIGTYESLEKVRNILKAKP
jgi:MurNAc alpha-1-phosphate uridylyltransferase